jgi:quercetin dioxygenase-like cupin family protein
MILWSCAMGRYNWDQVPREELSPLITRQVIHTSYMTVMRITFKRGAVVSLHEHFHEQVTMLCSGRLHFDLDGEEIVLEAGEILRIPPNAPHRAEALEDSLGIDVFSPARED